MKLLSSKNNSFLLFLMITSQLHGMEVMPMPRWISECFSRLYEFNQPVRPSLGTMYQPRDFETTNIIPKDVFKGTLAQYIEESMRTLQINEHEWINKDAQGKTIPYAQALCVNAEQKVVVIGDLHGCVHSLLRNLIRMRVFRLLDENFRVRDNAIIVFTGDYGDRGQYSLETIFSLLLFKLINAHNVILLRGNHETMNIMRIYGTEAEILSKLRLAKISDEYGQLRTTFDDFFATLPSVLFIGTRNGTAPVKFIQLCHGGVSNYYDDDKEKMCTANAKMLLARTCHLDENTATFESFPHMAIDNGYLWNDFCSFPQTADPHQTIFVGRRGIGDYCLHGDGVLQYLLELSEPEEFTLEGILRGHEHLTGGINKLKFNSAARLQTMISPNQENWTPLTPETPIAIRYQTLDGSDGYPVYTFNSVSTGFSGDLHEQTCDAFGILSFDTEANQWMLMPHIYYPNCGLTTPTIKSLELSAHRYKWKVVNPPGLPLFFVNDLQRTDGFTTGIDEIS